MNNLIKAGVVQANNLEWIWDDVTNGDDIGWLEYASEYPDDSPELEYYEGQGDTLIGFKKCNRNNKEAWFAHKGKYSSFAFRPDPDAEYSAIYRSDSNVLQVVRSNWIRLSPFCSPCYPDQGNLDSPPDAAGGGMSYTLSFQTGPVWAYTVPPELVGEYGDQQLKHTAVRFHESADDYYKILGKNTLVKYTFDEIVSGVGNVHAYPGEAGITIAKPLADNILLKNGHVLVSVQASSKHYCSPRGNYGPYDTVEVYLTNRKYSRALGEYRTPNDPQLHGYVPVHLVRKFIESYGGEA